MVEGMAEGAPMVCIAGPSGSGKTTLMEELIRELSRRGYRVATIKHTHHAVELDQPGKDSWRHRQAGATVSVVVSRRSVAIFGDLERELTVEELSGRFIHQADLILAEGYKSGGTPKIVVVGDGAWDAAEWTGVKAVVSARRINAGVPVFPPTDVKAVASFLEHEFLGRRKI